MKAWIWRGVCAGLLLAELGALVACGGPSSLTPVAGNIQYLDQKAGLPAARPSLGMSFSVIKTGQSLGALEGLVVEGGSWFKVRRPIYAAVLVKHPRGVFMFDTGLGRRIDEQFSVNSWLHRRFFGYGEVHAAADQMVQAGWAPEDVRMIVPSHLHWDHASGLPDFPQAEVLATGDEVTGARQGRPPAFLASQFNQVQHWRELSFQGPAYLGFPASHDLFDDGSVVLVPLGGHTAGQVGLFLTLPSGRRYFFIGDVTWTIEGARWGADRSWLVRQVLHLDNDPDANRRCIAHVQQIIQRYPEVTVVPAHDENVYETLAHFPQFQE